MFFIHGISDYTLRQTGKALDIHPLGIYSMIASSRGHPFTGNPFTSDIPKMFILTRLNDPPHWRRWHVGCRASR